tara:strand:+ start:798 stop:1286 length:489 start_codon:yes stop_codon:yes gene_type:complete
MKLFLKLILIFLIASMLQQIFPKISFLGGLKIPFFTSIMLYSCFRLDDKKAWICSIITAFIYDSLEPGPYGPTLLAYPFITYLILKYRRNLFHNGLITQVICGGLTGVITTIIAAFIYLITDIRPLNYLFLKIIGSLLLGAITLPVCSKILSEFIPSQERGG